MRSAMIAAATLMMMSAAAEAQTPARTPAQKSCILGAAAKLPVIQGLTITASDTRPLSKEESAKLKSAEPDAVVVGLTVHAAALDALLIFFCSQGGAVIVPMGLGN